MQNKKMLGVFAALYSIFVWGTTFVVTRNLMDDFNPAEILFVRFLIAYLILIFMGRKNEKPQGAQKKDEWLFFFSAFSGLFLYGVLEILSMKYTYASNTSTIVSSNPFFIALFATIFTKAEKPTFMFYFGFVVAMLGIGIISFNGATEFGLNPLGDLLALGSAISWGFYSVFIAKAYQKGYKTVYMTKQTYLWGTLILLAFMPVYGFNRDLSRYASFSNWLGLAFLGVIASCTCFLTWNYATDVLGPVSSSVFIYIIPVITVVFASIFLNEKMNAMSFLGIALVLSGTVLSSIKRRK